MASNDKFKLMKLIYFTNDAHVKFINYFSINSSYQKTRSISEFLIH